MSLTSHLRSSSSPISAYLNNVSPSLADTKGTSRGEQKAAGDLGLIQLKDSKLVVPSQPDTDASLSGTAIDFRARINLGCFDPRDSVAALGIAGLSLYAARIDNSRHRFQILTEAFDVAAKILDAPSNDSEIDRACILLAYCEQVYRAGSAAFAGFLGDALDEANSGLAFSRRISDRSLADMKALLRANESELRIWRELIANGERFISNPEFAGSSLVGGADADWIIGDTLIECKAYERLTVANLRRFIQQLLGYVMLDLDDALGIRNVGLWLPRQGLTKTWTLTLLLGGEPDELLPNLRKGFLGATRGNQPATHEKTTQRRKHQILADNFRTPRWMLVELAQRGDRDIRFRIGRNPETPEPTLRQLAIDKYARPREGVARNENTPVDVLTDLSNDPCISVRRAATGNVHARAMRATVTKSVISPVSTADTAIILPDQRSASTTIRKNRVDESLDTRWFAEFLAMTRGATALGLSSLPVPRASHISAFLEGRSLEIPSWLQECLPYRVKLDLMRESRPARVRRNIAEDLPISEALIRERLLTDTDPEIRWSALQRTRDFPDPSLGELLGRLMDSRKTRLQFRIGGESSSHTEFYRTRAEYDKEVLVLIAAHPSTPQAALTRLLASKSPEIIAALVENPALSPENLAALLPRIKVIRSCEIRARLACSAQLPASAAVALQDDRSPEVRLALARNNVVPPEVLCRLATDPELSIRLAVAVHPLTDSNRARAIIEPLLRSVRDEELLDVLEKADERDDIDLPKSLVEEALERVSKSPVDEPEMCRVVGADTRARRSTLTRLALSTDALVRSEVAGNTSVTNEVLRSLAVDGDPNVRSSAAQNVNLSTMELDTLARDEDSEVRAAAAAQSLLDSAVLNELLSDEEAIVRRAASKNPSTRSEDLSRYKAEQERLWRNTAPSRPELEELVAHNRTEVRTKVAYDLRTPPDVLMFLSGDRRSVQVRRAVAANPYTPAKALLSLADEKDVEVQQAVAFNRATPPEVLIDLAGRSIDLALLVTLNPGVPRRVLDLLAEDSNPLVSYVAVGAQTERGALTRTAPAAEMLELS